MLVTLILNCIFIYEISTGNFVLCDRNIQKNMYQLSFNIKFYKDFYTIFVHLYAHFYKETIKGRITASAYTGLQLNMVKRTIGILKMQQLLVYTISSTEYWYHQYKVGNFVPDMHYTVRYDCYFNLCTTWMIGHSLRSTTENNFLTRNNKNSCHIEFMHLDLCICLVI